MPVASKEVLSAEQEEIRRQEAVSTVKMLGPLVFVIVLGGQLLNQSRPALVKAITKGDVMKAASMLATYGGLGGAAEFILNPIVGRMSDRFGRRPLLLLSPITCSLLRGLVFLFPGSWRMILVERMLSSPVVTGFFSTMRAMLNDKLNMEELVIAGGAIGTYAGLGVIMGPYVEAFVMKFLSARYNFLAVALINVGVSIAMFKTAKETLPLSERKPLTVKDCSPLTFLEMFKVSTTNTKLMMVLLFQSFGEIRVCQDINMLNLRENLKWTPFEMSNFMSLIGVSVVVGGKTIKTSLQKLGMRGHTTMSNLIMALAFYVQGTQSKYFSQLFAVSLYFLGGRKRDAVEAMCSDITLANSNMGKGQVSAALMNFKSLGAIFGPPMSGAAYNYGQRHGIPGLAYWIIGLMHLAAESVHISITNKELGIKT